MINTITKRRADRGESSMSDASSVTTSDDSGPTDHKSTAVLPHNDTNKVVNREPADAMSYALLVSPEAAGSVTLVDGVSTFKTSFVRKFF